MEEYKMKILVSVINTVRNGIDVTVYNDSTDKLIQRLTKTGLSEYEATEHVENLKNKYTVSFIDYQSII
jgi:hypothetical protein